MSQLEVYKILKELGGKATTRQISDRAKVKFPNLALHTYVYDRLRKLMKKGCVTRTRNENDYIVWKIVAEYA